MKTLSTASAATALGIDQKVLDNALAREARSLVSTGRRGRNRRIPVAALERIAVAFVLNRDLGVSVAKGLELAELILATPASPVPIGKLGSLTFDVSHLQRMLEVAVDEALESVAEPIRGRPKRLMSPRTRIRT
jgi:hypothetical protein